ncbi:hypothetical protein Acr_09g0001510 [Actinidia rufa]|uniref:Uncharacterized protein n=1 Tax=Actinidia rufa TaxID=165716 RepID=A0A7J0F4T8_9ERIC|nr:hypothetical protein Acr_09g0001510 [Actinidia rufa]
MAHSLCRRISASDTNRSFCLLTISLWCVTIWSLVHELPFLDSEQVHLVPQVLQVFLFSHPGPPRRLPVRYHPPKPSIVHNRAVPVRVVGIVVIVVVPRTGVGSDGVWVGVVWTGVGQDWFLGERGRFLGWEREKRFLAIPGGKTSLESREWDSKESVVGWHGGESRQHGRKTAYSHDGLAALARPTDRNGFYLPARAADWSFKAGQVAFSKELFT